MKRKLIILMAAGTVGLVSCDILTGVANEVLSGEGTVASALTNDEVVAGLKEALEVGIKNGSGKASALDGFLKNDLIRLPFPEDAIFVKEKALQLGLDNKVNEFETTLK